MKRIIFVTFCLLMVLSFGCVNEKTKKDHKSTIVVSKNLYVEIYRVFGAGALGGDLLSEYLTDSTNFRMYIGTFDDNIEFYSYRCANGNIYVEKMSRKDQANFELQERKTFILNKLKKERLFD